MLRCSVTFVTAPRGTGHAARRAALLFAALLALCAPLCSLAAFTLPTGQNLLSLRAVAAVSGGKSILTHGTTWSDLMGTTWADGPNAGAWSPASMSGLGYGTVFADGNGNGPAWQTSGDILSVCMVNALTGWAVGNAGTIVFTSNGGQTWAAQVSPTGADLDLYSVACLSATTAVAVGEQGVILRTANAGVTWSKVTASSFVDLFCVSFGDASNGIATGLNGQIFATVNGGATWTDARPAISTQRTTGTLLACSVPPGTTAGFAAGTGGVVMTSSNIAAGSGAAIAFTKVPTATSLVATAAGDPNLLDSADTAVTSMAFTDANTGWLTTSGGGIVAFRGGNWVQQRASPSATSHLRDIGAVDASHAYAVGNGGQVLITTDGVTWGPDTGNFPGSTSASTADIVAIAVLPAFSAPPSPQASPPPPPSTLASATTTTWTGAVNALGVAGRPSARTLFISYASNWQFNLSTAPYPPIQNNNFYAIQIFNPTCNNVVLDSYLLLFITSTQGVPGDGDWSEATTIPFPAGTTLPPGGAFLACSAPLAGTTLSTLQAAGGYVSPFGYPSSTSFTSNRVSSMCGMTTLPLGSGGNPIALTMNGQVIDVVGNAGPITTGFAVTDNTALPASVTNTGYRAIMRANTVVAGNANWAYSSLNEWTNVYTCTGTGAGAYCYTVLAASYLTARITAVLSTTCASAPTTGAKPSVAPGTVNVAITTIAAAKATTSSTCPPTYTNAGQTVTLTGKVTALVANGFYMQDSNNLNSGIFVANTGQNVVDQVVTVTGAALVQFGGQLQLQGGTVAVAASQTLNPAPLSLGTPPSSLLTACSSASSPGGVQYEGMVVQFSGSVTLQAATASGGNQLGYLTTTSGMLVVGTQSYMQNYQAGGTFASMNGVIVGTPAMQNAYAALYVRGPADLGTYSKTIFTTNTCVTAGQCTGATVAATLTNLVASGSSGVVTHTPLSIFSAGMRPFGPPTTVLGTTFAPTGYTPMSAIGAVSVPPVLLTSSSGASTVGGTGFASNPSSVFATCSGSSASVWATAGSPYAPYLNQKVYIEGIFTSVAPVSQYIAITDFSYVSNAVSTCDASCMASLPAGAAPLAYFSNPSFSGCSGPTIQVTAGQSGWCASCTYPSGYYMSTSEVSGPFSGLSVNLNPDQIQYLLPPNNLYPMATFCPTFTGASLLPQFPSSTTTLRLGVTGTLTFDSDTGSGLVLSSITSTTVLSANAAMVQAQQLSTQAFSYTWPGTQNNALGAALINSPSSSTVQCAGTTPTISNPAFVPYKGAVVSFPSVTVMSYVSSLVLDSGASAKSGYYVVTDTNAGQAYPIIISSMLYNSWKPQALAAGLTAPALFQCAIIAPLTGILDWNANLLAWTVQPRFSNDISNGALSLALNTRCSPACGGGMKQLSFPTGSSPASLPGPTVTPPACAYPPPPPPSPPPPLASPPPTAPIMPPPSPSPRPPSPSPTPPRPPPPAFPPPAAEPPPPPLAPTPVTYVAQNVTIDVLVINLAPSSDPLGIGGVAGNLPTRILLSYVEAVNAEAINASIYPAGVLSTSNVQTFWPSIAFPAIASAGDATGYPAASATAVTKCSSGDSLAGTNGCIGRTYMGAIIQSAASRRHLASISGRRMLQSGVPKLPEGTRSGRELMQLSAAALALQQRISYPTYGGTAPMNTVLASTGTPAAVAGTPPGATSMIVTGYTVYAVLQFANVAYATINTAAARTSVLSAAFNDFSNYVSVVNTGLDSQYLLQSAVTQSMFQPYGAWQDTTTTSAANFLMVIGTTANPLPNYYVASAILSWLFNAGDPNNGTFPVLKGPSSLASVSGTSGAPTLYQMPTGVPSPQLGAKLLFQHTLSTVAQANAIASAASAAVVDGTLCKAMLYNSMQCFASPVVLPVSTVQAPPPDNFGVPVTPGTPLSVASQATLLSAVASAASSTVNSSVAQSIAASLDLVASSALISNNSAALAVVHDVISTLTSGQAASLLESANLTLGAPPTLPATTSSSTIQTLVQVDPPGSNRLTTQPLTVPGASSAFEPMPTGLLPGTAVVVTSFYSYSFDPYAANSTLRTTGLTGLAFSNPDGSPIVVANATLPVRFTLPPVDLDTGGAAQQAVCAFWDPVVLAYSTQGCAVVPNPAPAHHVVSFIPGFQAANDAALALAWNISGPLVAGGQCFVSALDCSAPDPLTLSAANVTCPPPAGGTPPVLRLYSGAQCALVQPTNGYGCSWSNTMQAFVGAGCVSSTEPTACMCRHLTDFASAAVPVIVVAPVSAGNASAPPGAVLPPTSAFNGTVPPKQNTSTAAILSNQIIIIVLSIAGGLLLIAVSVIVCLCFRLHRNKKQLLQLQQPLGRDLEAGKNPRRRIPDLQVGGLATVTTARQRTGSAAIQPSGPMPQAANLGAASPQLAGAASTEETVRQLRSIANNNKCSRCGGGLALRRREQDYYYVRCTNCRCVFSAGGAGSGGAS